MQEPPQIEDFCHRWKIVEFALFGSIVREDMNPDSDVDVLVRFADDARLSLYYWVDMEDELRGIFGREVDLVSKSGLRNPVRRHEILRTRKVIYASTSALEVPARNPDRRSRT
ncbi:MAG: nucleotidyltransferase domain-containing protein [Deltaproteobacteria bacterium]|nr:nucleotidyltransferase domain-containing protein [Deltaproteobacteria bacterium]